MHAIDLAASSWSVPGCIPLRSTVRLVGYYSIPSFVELSIPPVKKRTTPAPGQTVIIDIHKTAVVSDSDTRARKSARSNVDSLALAAITVQFSPSSSGSRPEQKQPTARPKRCQPPCQHQGVPSLLWCTSVQPQDTPPAGKRQEISVRVGSQLHGSKLFVKLITPN